MRWVVDGWWRLVRFGFRLLYNEFAFTYDLVSKIVSLGSWRCWQRSALQHLTVSRTALVLELAHGTGDLQIDLQQAGYKTIGYDLSPFMGQITRRKLHQHHLPAALARGRAQQLPFIDCSVDAVIATFPTEFIVDPQTLDEVYRLLPADGQFIIVLNGTFTGRGVVQRFLEFLYRITGQRAAANHSLYRHVLDLFTAHGFEAQIHEETCPGSVVQLLVATKRV